MKTILNMVVFLLLTGSLVYSQKSVIESKRELFDKMQKELRTFVDGIKEGMNKMGFQPVEISSVKNFNGTVEAPILARTEKEISSTVSIYDNLPDIYPIDKVPVISSIYGYRSDPFSGKLAFHPGVDIAINEGSDIRSTGNGKVITAAYDRARGNYIIIDHGNSYQSYYGHLSRIMVKKGDDVHKKQVIGKSGNTGLSTGPHLHYGILYKGKFINPISIIL